VLDMDKEVANTSEWMTIPEAASQIKSGIRTIRTAIHRKELKACAINGRGDQRIHQDWLREFMAARAARG
jgi:excisionase family DNA binding protein